MTLTAEQIEALPSRYVHRKSHLPYAMAKNAVNTLAPDVKSAGKYRKWIKETKSYYMPVHPERIYPDFSWSDFLDSDTKSFVALVAERRERACINPRPVWDAIKWAQRYCHANGITRRSDWEKHFDAASDIPQDIPKRPHITYKPEYPGFEVWCGRNASALTDAARNVTPILTLLHVAKQPQNVLQLVSWSDGVGDLREKWSKQSDFDRIIGCWVLEPELMDNVNRIIAENASSDGERITVANTNQLTWELNSLLAMVKL